MTRKLGAIFLALALVLSLGLMPAVALADNDNECVRYGQGYWKQWLSDPDPEWECAYGFSAEELLGMLNTPARGNPTQILLYQFIAAALNMGVYECVMPPAVSAAFGAALEHLGFYLEGEDSGATRAAILGWKDILEFWNENKYAELLSVVYEGEGDLFGSHIGDKLTFTFSNDVFITDDIEIDRTGPTSEGYLRLHKHPYMDFGVSGNVLTVTVNTAFSSPRILDMRPVEEITGLYDVVGNPVVVPDGGVWVTP